MSECVVPLVTALGAMLCLLGLLGWTVHLHLQLWKSTAEMRKWREKAIIGEVLRSRGAFVKAMEDEAERPRDYNDD